MNFRPIFFAFYGVLLAALCSVGCGGARSPQARGPKLESRDGSAVVGQQPAKEAAADEAAIRTVAQAGEQRAAAEAVKKPAGGAGNLPTPIPRKVIYNATVELIADDLGTTEQELRQLVKRAKGYIAKSELRGTAGTRRSGTWTIRVPVSHFDDFREGLVKLGEVQRDSLDSQDVTDQFYDLEARIRTNQAEEESLRKLLAQAQGQDQFFHLRQELNRLRGDLEVQQGQLQRLDKLSALATYNITIQERRGYVPPETPSFDTRLSRTWGDSIDALRTFGQAVVLIAVALAPWLPVLAVIVGPIWLLVRRRYPSIPVAAPVEPVSSAG